MNGPGPASQPFAPSMGLQTRLSPWSFSRIRGVVLTACAFAAQGKTAQTQAKNTQLRKQILASGTMTLLHLRTRRFGSAQQIYSAYPGQSSRSVLNSLKATQLPRQG